MDAIKIKETILEYIRFKLQRRFSGHILQQINVDMLQQLSDDIILNFETHILGKHNKKKYAVEFKSPLNWWQHFKLEKLPNWFKKKYPVKYKTEQRTFEFDHIALISELDLEHIKNKGRVIIHTLEPINSELIKVN